MGASATVKGGFWPENGIATLTQAQGTGPVRQRIKKLMRTKGMAAVREIMLTDNGVAPGQVASAVRTRIANSTELGGKRTIENETFINRVTVAGDVTETNADLFELHQFDSTPIDNKDGNPLGTR